jgi:hypothetical protein
MSQKRSGMLRHDFHICWGLIQIRKDGYIRLHKFH